MNTQTVHIQHTTLVKGKGYIWRKRHDGGMLTIHLQTYDVQEAQKRATQMTLRYMQLSQFDVPLSSMKDTLTKYRDSLIHESKIVQLNMMLGTASQSVNSHYEQDALQAPVMGEAMQSPSQSEKVAYVAIQEELAAFPNTTLEACKKSFFEANTEWKEKTVKDYSACIDRFILWGIANNVVNVADVTKSNIITFKAYMDENNLAPNTKQKILTRLSSMFSYAVDVKEWISKNPVSGMMYKKVGVVNQKEEITPDQFSEVMALPSVLNDKQTYWAMNLMYYTGMRISEVCQITKADYVEIEGIKCVSVNTHEEGKSTKTETSKRNIPLCNALLALNVWEEKPVMKTGVNRNMDWVSRSFALIGLKRSTHCFRHGLSNRLRDTSADDSTRAFILGHAQANMTDRVYITRAPLIKMQNALNECN